MVMTATCGATAIPQMSSMTAYILIFTEPGLAFAGRSNVILKMMSLPPMEDPVIAAWRSPGDSSEVCTGIDVTHE